MLRRSELASKCDILTLEVEHVNAQALEELHLKGVPVQPLPFVVKLIQDKYDQKVHLQKHRIPLPDFLKEAELHEIGEKFGYPMMLKSRFGAYDGKGNAVVTQKEQELAQKIATDAIKSFGDARGIFGVEMFLLDDGSVLLNEIAPRPHNTAQEACGVDQFEQHLRAVLGLPLGDCHLRVGGAMMDAAVVLDDFGIPYEISIVSAHRTPEYMYEYATTAADRGINVIIAGAGGAAHLPGMVAALTPLPVIGVPVKSSALSGNDSLLSIMQMPKGIPVATVAIGNAANAGLLAVRILGAANPGMRQKMAQFMANEATTVEKKRRKLEQVGWQAYLADSK
eukprot:g29754.t1